MCGRFTLAAKPELVARLFGLAATPPLTPRYNVAPGQQVATVGRRADGSRGLGFLKWGLVPRDTADPKGGKRPINARGETAATLATFRDCFRARRCLVPADGFYEWQTAGLATVPHHFRRADGGAMGLAGLWDVWRGPDGCKLATCCLLTTAANRLVRPVHDRMPAILPEATWEGWLSSDTPTADLRALLVPFPAEQMASVIVGPAVNRPVNDGAECVQPAGRSGHIAAWADR